MKNAILIANDIGGFRLAYEFLVAKYERVKCLVRGPALEESLMRRAEVIQSLAIVNDTEYDIYICTGWETVFEKRWMKYCDINSLRWTAILDNWNDYSSRFLLDAKYYLPNLIIVFDVFAHTLCKSTFPNTECKLAPNFFDLNFIEAYQKLENSGVVEKRHDLFLADPISSHYGDKLGYNEYDQIKYILKKLNSKYSVDHPLIIRAHPSENQEKYIEYISENKLDNVMVSNTDLLNDLYLADLVFGDSSYAMHLAILVGKQVYCSIPINSMMSQLPHNEVKYLRELDV